MVSAVDQGVGEEMGAATLSTSARKLLYIYICVHTYIGRWGSLVMSMSTRLREANSGDEAATEKITDHLDFACLQVIIVVA